MDCFAFDTRRTARAVTNYMNGVLKPFDLTTAQFGLLMAVDKRPDSSLREISVNLLLDESTMTRNLAVLERRGLVQSEGGRGRQGKKVSLSAEGHALLEACTAKWRAANQELEARLDPELVRQGRLFLKALTLESEALSAAPTGRM